MYDLSARLDHLGPQIEQLISIGGTPGLSLGIVTNGKPQYQRSYGFRDSENKLHVDQNTVFPTGSLTKAVTAAALGILVDEGKATWRTLVRNALPSFQPRDRFFWANLTITDLLCHRDGISWADNLVIGSDNNILVSYEDAMTCINDQTILLPFRGQFSYSNVAFDIAGSPTTTLSRSVSSIHWACRARFSRLPLRTSTTSPRATMHLMTSVTFPSRAPGLGTTGTWSRQQGFAAVLVI